MYRAVTFGLISLLLYSVSIADEQKLPPTVKTGADFVWHVAHAKNVKESLSFDEAKATVKLEPKSKVVLERMISDLKNMRADLEPMVVACKQEFFNREMSVVYVLSSKANVQKYYRLHIVVVSEPPLIDVIEELTWHDVLDGKCLKIAQEVPE